MKYLYFIFKNLGRKKVRTVLTVLSIMIAFLLFGLLRSLSAAFDGGAQIAGEDRLVSINKVTLIQPLPYAYLAKVKALPGVEIATMANWFGGYYQDKKNQFPQFPVNADVHFSLYKDSLSISDDALKVWKQDRTGAVIGEALAKKFGWKVGDRIPLISMFPQKNGSTTWEFTIDGIFKGTDKGRDTNFMYFHYDYFDKARQFDEGTIGWMIIKVKDPKQSPEVAKAIDALFENSSAETKTDSEKEFAKSFAKQFGDVGLITTIILGAVFFTMLLVAGNNMSQSFRERIPEIAVLKTLGFKNQTVMCLILAEALIICGIGGLLGLSLAGFFLSLAKDALAANLPGMHMGADVIFSGLIWIVVFGAVTGVVPAVQGLRLNIISALRRN